MDLHPSVAQRLDRLAADQRTAAAAPPGPILCVAPAGSGKTTTLVARIAWLVGRGADPSTICAITFNRRAAEELDGRLSDALVPLGVPTGTVRVRTFHALGREILTEAGCSVEPLVDRMTVLRELAPEGSPALFRRLDDAFSRLKLDLGLTAGEVAADPSPGPVARAFMDYERAIEAIGGLDFDDLVGRALRLLEARPEILALWRARCAHLLVDEVQDVDRSQLRLALLLAAPANSIFLVGDDDQSIYGWRLADVRRVLALAGELPGLRRIDLETNYRCPAAVVERSVRLVERNRERFAKRVRPGPQAGGRLVLAPDGSDEIVRLGRVVDRWPNDDGSRAILARTNRELLPAVALALERAIPFRAPRVELLLDSPLVEALIGEADDATDDRLPLPMRLRALQALVGAEAKTSRQGTPSEFSRAEVAAALLAWAAPYSDLGGFRDAVRERQRRLGDLRRDDAQLTLATAHATKGLEFDHVAVIGLEAGRFPSRRALDESPEPGRALEEERRLAYVAWTRARRSLTLVYDPAAPSPFLLEAFDARELDLPVTVGDRPPGRATR